MSGGSWNYLCYKVEEMAEKLVAEEDDDGNLIIIEKNEYGEEIEPMSESLREKRKTFGKLLLSVFLYVIYWILFYFIIPFIIIAIQGFNFGGVFLLFFLLILAPVLSFCIPKIIIKTSDVNKCLLYVVHILLIILPLVVYVFLVLSSIKNGFSQMFI